MNGGAGPYVWRTLDWSSVNEYGSFDPPVPFTFDLAGRIRPRARARARAAGCAQSSRPRSATSSAPACTSSPHRTDAMSETDYEIFLRDTFTRLRDGAPAVPGVNGDRPSPDWTRASRSRSSSPTNSGTDSSRQPLDAARGSAPRPVGARIHRRRARARVAHRRRGLRRPRSVRRFVGGGSATPTSCAASWRRCGRHARGRARPSCYFRPRPESIALWLSGATAARAPTVRRRTRSSTLPTSPSDAAHGAARARAVAEAFLNPDGSHPRLELYEAGQAFDARGEPWARRRARPRCCPRCTRPTSAA